ncbi:MAG: radical SAM protein [Lachnospiraceae bacterium]|nr:radical SAM protein [Ruminococcus sp.]MCM1274151.1 radical SAM protein [Lachnospiraceae bacterium]
MHKVQAKAILSAKNGMNVYRGCTHGCIYCDSRSDCYNFTHDFEDIEVKENAPELLEKALKAKRRRCMIGTGAMCDPYLHAERELEITRRCLEIIYKYGFGAAVLTKSDLIMRDIDLLEKINDSAKAVVQMTLTTADEELCRIVEPNVCTTARRLEVLSEMKKRGIPTVVWFTPQLPYINDTAENVRAVVEMSARAGVLGILSFGMGMTLRGGDREYYYAQLDRHFPDLKRRYIREFGNSYEIPSPNGKALRETFVSECERHGIIRKQNEIFEYLNAFPEPEQLQLEI